MRKKGISVRDIARECDVAIGTVSRVLNRQKVRPDLAEKVLAAVERHNYNPNLRLLRKVRTRTIRVVMPYYGSGDTANLAEGFYARGLEGVKRAVFEKGYELSLTGETQFREALVPAPLDTAAGVLLFTPHGNWDAEVDRAQSLGLPVALVNRTTTRKNVIVVREKDRAAMFEKMAGHLAGLGRRNIICVMPRIASILRQAENFINACHKLGLPCNEDSVLHIEDDPPAYLASHPRPDAIFASSDIYAMSIMKILRALNLRVPDDIAVTGYDNLDIGRFTHPELTTVDSHIDQMAALAAKLLIERIEGSEFGQMEVEIEGELVVRESCGAKLRSAKCEVRTEEKKE
jgi:DNA-binding LacI/PurR family transcriptional regulator